MRVWLFSCLLFVPLAWAQTTIQIVPEGAVAGNLGAANITITSIGSSETSALEWTLTYSTSVFSGMQISAGPALKAAGKSLACTSGAGQLECIAWGANTTTIENGVIALASFAVSSPAPASSTLGLTEVTAVNAAGAKVAVTGIGATLTITPASAADKIAKLACAETSLVTPGATVCTVTMDSVPKVPTKVTLGLGGGSAKVILGSSVTVPINSKDASFSVSAKTVTSPETAIVVTSANGSSATVNLSLVP